MNSRIKDNHLPRISAKLNLGKIAEATQILTEKDSGLTVTKWNKLLFISDCVACNHPGLKKTILEGTSGVKYIKMPYGPMIDRYEVILRELESHQFIKLTSYIGLSSNMATLIHRGVHVSGEMTTIEVEIIQKVTSAFLKYDSKLISEFSHRLKAWINANMFSRINISDSEYEPFLTGAQRNKSANNLYELLFSD